MKGMYNGEILLKSKGCVTCGEGLLCDEAGMDHPKQATGYYIDNNNPSAVYLCEPKETCLGANWSESVCRQPRHGFMCMECPDGQVPNSNFDREPAGCVDCSIFTSAIILIAPLGAFCFCCMAMYTCHPSPLDESPLTVELQNTIGQLVMFVQVSNAIFATRMLYGEPLDGFMYMVISHLDPDAIFRNAPCLAPSFGSPVANYGFVILSPAIFIIALSLVCLLGKCLMGLFSVNGLINVIGEVLIEFYISVTLAIFAPFNCFKHPNGETSVQKYPQVICLESDHNGMVGLAVFGILAYPVAAMVVSVYMTWQYPRSMMKNDIGMLVKGRFLFDRWQPSCYWFCNVSLTRNFLIAVFPCVMPQDALDVTILLMTLALLVALILLVWFKPRRTPQQNRILTAPEMVFNVLMCSCSVGTADPAHADRPTAARFPPTDCVCVCVYIYIYIYMYAYMYI